MDDEKPATMASLRLAGDRAFFVPVRRDAAGQLRLEVRQDDDAARAMVFTSQERLIEGCGEFQPWAAVPGAALNAQLAESGVGEVVLDGALAESARWTADGPPPTLAGAFDA